jgi:hypothetical protein
MSALKAAIGRLRHKLPELWQLFEQPTPEFDAWLEQQQRKSHHNLAHFARFDASLLAKGANVTNTISGLRVLWRAHGSWLAKKKEKVAEMLLAGKVLCRFCRGTTAASGCFNTYLPTLDYHAKSQSHLENVAAAARGARQIELSEMRKGVILKTLDEQRKRRRMLAVGGLLAGTSEAEGLP